MKKNTLEITITIVLVIVLIFALGNVFKNRKKGIVKAKPIKIATPAEEKTSAAAGSMKSWKELEKFAENLKCARDPFTYAPTYSAGGSGDLKLDGILYDKESPKAMINGIILGVGERIDNYTVSAITPDSVLLTDGANEIELKL